MSYPSKAWLILICLLSYLFMGQAGCQTTSQDTMYMRSDMIRIKRDVAEIKEQMGSPVPSANRDVLRNQAKQNEALEELKEGQQRTESRIEEARYEISVLRQEITNLKLNLISQLEALRATSGSSSAATPRVSQPPATAAPKPVAPAYAPPATSTPAVVTPTKPAPLASPAKPVTPVKPSVPEPAPTKPAKAIDYTKLYDTAYDDYSRKNYSLARNGFEEYLRQFPDTDLADNAQYWIGECYFSEGNYTEATEAFKKVITMYPTGNKVPRAMLKAGFALLELGKQDQARDMFHQVIDAYPLSAEADQARTKLQNID